jgi:hypothetical protein
MDCMNYVTEVGMHFELVAYGQNDGRWDAHVTFWQFLHPSRTAAELTTGLSAALWPSVNGSVAAMALDVLEAAPREVIAATP